MRSSLNPLILSLLLSSAASFGTGSDSGSSGPSHPLVLKILSFNVGGADAYLRIPSFKFDPYCPVYKLCRPEVAEKIHAHIQENLPDVALIQEAQGETQLVGSQKAGPVFPSQYDARCTTGAATIREVCIVWNKNRVRLAGNCSSVNETNSGSISCPFEMLEMEGSPFWVVNTHPNAWVEAERNKNLSRLWRELVNVHRPTIVGGDFNTEDGTYGGIGNAPYPPEFGSLFGKFQKNYGRWNPDSTFYGSYSHSLFSNKRVAKNRRSTALGEKLDHIFANFGEPLNSAEFPLPCADTTCLGGVSKGYHWSGCRWQWGPVFGPEIDHRPILTQLRWTPQ